MKRLSLIFILLTTMLAACAPQTGGDGFFQSTFVQPFTSLIELLAGVTGDNYGLAIVLITVIIRLVVMPFMLSSYKKQQDMKSKMEVMKPEMEDIQGRLKGASSEEERKEAQQELVQLYQKHGVNPLNMGCLPMLLQMPILMGFYFAIRGSEEVASHTFLWFNLGETDLLLAVIAGILYFINYRISMMGLPEQQQKQMKVMGLLSPVMILVISLSTPAALPLYWAVGGLFLIVQTYVSKRMYQRSPSTGVSKTEQPV
ncbi:OxaA precursor [Pontibacillus halophilus JSM 076056 = DSM 19796]|uniref:Membrane protein insertase YidC n=1 Tax=Pontibacillus halophilus JSM 076056 = DSM 19796 TaxID=1385510 RepID=A0A0A5GBX2_9BACI|nr:membrane protein insertase YidC [Pontibacillus halophilus]KGX90686.1 OxaA precursor [Pontibacillus halophilus JSM 076056 = DSM 19796]